MSSNADNWANNITSQNIGLVSQPQQLPFLYKQVNIESYQTDFYICIFRDFNKDKLDGLEGKISAVLSLIYGDDDPESIRFELLSEIIKSRMPKTKMITDPEWEKVKDNLINPKVSRYEFKLFRQAMTCYAKTDNLVQVTQGRDSESECESGVRMDIK